MKKKAIVILAVALFTTSVVGVACNNKAENTQNIESVAAANISEIADKLKTEIKYDDKLSEMEEESFPVVYDEIPRDKVKEMKVYLSSSGGTSEEIACFTAVDSEAASQIESGLKARIEAQKKSFENYVPEELKRLDKAVVVRNGENVYLSVSSNPEKAMNIIENK